MTRAIQITGECMVMVKGPAGSQIASLTQLGLSPDQITVTPKVYREEVKVNAYGYGAVPVDFQVWGGEATISMTLVNFDIAILEECFRLGMAAPAYGQMGRTGTLLGGTGARFAEGNNYIGLNITAPVNGLPYRFLYAYLESQIVLPYGTQRQIAQCTWGAIAFTNDPWGGGTAQPNTAAGTGSQGAVIWDHTLDT